MKYHQCKPLKPNLWAPGAIHGESDHDECTEWKIFKLDPRSDPEDGDIVPVEDNEMAPMMLSYWNAKAICEAHNRDVALALEAESKGAKA